MNWCGVLRFCRDLHGDQWKKQKAYSETLNETAVSFLNNYGNCVGDFGYICCNGSSENHSFPNVSLPFLDQPSVNFKDKSNGFWWCHKFRWNVTTEMWGSSGGFREKFAAVCCGENAKISLLNALLWTQLNPNWMPSVPTEMPSVKPHDITFSSLVMSLMSN